jgi:small conductance mechanosensitive channel
MGANMTIKEIKEYALMTLMDFGGQIIGVVLLLIVGWIVASFTSRLVRISMRKSGIDETLTGFVSHLARWSILVLFGLTCLSIFGIQTTSFAAVIGAVGIAIGLAFQGTLSNFAAGMMLLVFRPFKIGDFVEVAGHSGTVYALDLFTTALDTPGNRRLIIPNKSISGSVIENISHHPTRRVDVAVGTDYAADLERTRQALLEAALSVPDHLDAPKPVVVLLDLGASSIDWSVRVWADRHNFLAVKQGLIAAIKHKLDTAGIGIPYPQMDIHTDPAANSSSEP